MKKSHPISKAENRKSSKPAFVKRARRLPQRTVHTIAPANASLEHYDPSHSISPELAIAFSCKLMANALQLRTWSSCGDEIDSMFDLVESSIDDFEQTGDLYKSSGTALERLQLLMIQLQSVELSVREPNASAESNDHSKQVLTNAIHAVISSLSQRQQFHQAVEKVSQRAIYQFAYGLAHEINNPLANIAARAQQLIATANSETDRRSLATVVDQSMRAHEMLAEMMRVVQPRTIHPRIEDVVAIVRDAVAVQKVHWSHSQIQFSLRMPSKPLYSLVDKASLLEAICSVIQNALQVCRPNDRIEVICQSVGPDDPEYGPCSASGSDAVSSPRIRIAICDTGPGLTCESVERAWDLYYSGREHGRGLGISLANVHQTIDSLSGLVWIQSQPDAGCAVEMRLPKSAEPPNLRKVFSI